MEGRTEEKKKMTKRKGFYGMLLVGILAASLNLIDEDENTYRSNRGNVKVTYENDKIIGSISYADVEKFIKIVTLNNNGASKKYLMAKDYDWSNAPYGDAYSSLQYVNLENGVVMIYYYCGYPISEEEIKTERPVIRVGENIEIIEEESLLPYLTQKGIIQKEYDVNELIKFFYEEELDKIQEPVLNRSIE